ncbi:hypothetical protein [Daejeonella oryzae]|uniref:hypothetical protein n=1 Tax=Daejeonella oryzae TaxID=1122943 RepID=UPI00040DCE5B|nr:hypothetical protein [Daejeonella oryzae]
MKNNLENFIKVNKKEFDVIDPPADLWNKIEKQLDEDQKNQPKKERLIRLSWLFKIAAAFLIVMCAGLIIWQYQYNEATDLANIDPALAKQQMHYASLIEDKRMELKSIEKAEPQLYREFNSEIRKMDENYQKLKKDLPNSPNQEETVKAMIRNLQIQTQVLTQQLTIIQEINNSKKENDNETHSL